MLGRFHALTTAAAAIVQTAPATICPDDRSAVRIGRASITEDEVTHVYCESTTSIGDEIMQDVRIERHLLECYARNIPRLSVEILYVLVVYVGRQSAKMSRGETGMNLRRGARDMKSRALRQSGAKSNPLKQEQLRAVWWRGRRKLHSTLR